VTSGLKTSDWNAEKKFINSDYRTDCFRIDDFFVVRS
jgi:hypothetical protein